MTDNHLAILQYNLAKSKERMYSILNHPDTKQFTILALQEQYWSAYTNSSLTHYMWTLIESNATQGQQPRSAIYVNNTLVNSSGFEPIQVPIDDVTAVAIQTAEDLKPTLIVNVYNPEGRTNSLAPLKQFLQQNVSSNRYNTVLVLGDFNLHHPLWNQQEYHVHDSKADELINIMLENNLNLLLPPGTVTHPIGETTIDLVWGNDTAEQRIMKCGIAEKHDHGSDHLPIQIMLNLKVQQAANCSPPTYNYKETDWKVLTKKLETYLPLKLDSNSTTSATIDTYAGDLVKAIQKAIQETTPRKQISAHSKQWWKKELTLERRQVSRLRRKYNRSHNWQDWREWKTGQQKYYDNITKAKTEHWREFVTSADAQSIWKVKKYMDSVPTPTFIPTINETATTNEAKANEFQRVFFPPPPLADLLDINSSETPNSEEVACNFNITRQQVARAINKLSPDKAPGPDEITNRVIKENAKLLEEHLQILTQASLDVGYFPKVFKQTITSVLRKPSRPDYTIAKAYRPIALENTLGKVLESIIAELISYLTETHNLLPTQHYGGRPGRTAEDAMMVLSEHIHQAWK